MHGRQVATGAELGITRALADVAKVVGAHLGRAAVIGGIAVIARGVRRLTRDIDVAIAGEDLSAATLAEELERVGIVPRIEEAVAFAEQSQVLLVRHQTSGVDVDVSRAWLPFEIEAMVAATQTSLGGVRVAIATPDDPIIFKAVAWRPQDQQDVEQLIALGSQIDLEVVRADDERERTQRARRARPALRVRARWRDEGV